MAALYAETKVCTALFAAPVSALTVRVCVVSGEALARFRVTLLSALETTLDALSNARPSMVPVASLADCTELKLIGDEDDTDTALAVPVWVADSSRGGPP